jgi:oligopeptide/dipeptide ABC transporter ATP-binding protein
VIHAVNGIDLELERGRTLGVVGESGSGKSTMARMLMKLETPTSGELIVAGENLNGLRGASLRAWRKRVQMVFQDPTTSLNPRMTAGQTITEPWRIHRDLMPKKDWGRELDKLLESVGLRPEHAKRLPRALSGGQRQRVAIARALAVSPELIVCDEAVSSLDVSVQAQILNLLQDVKESTGVSFVFIAHDIAVVRHFCDDIAVMYLGRVLESGPCEDVLSRPRQPYTAALLAAEPVPHFERPDGYSPLVLRDEATATEQALSGCPFSPRCWRADEICRTVVPAMGVGERKTACHHPLDDGVGEQLLHGTGAIDVSA